MLAEFPPTLYFEVRAAIQHAKDNDDLVVLVCPSSGLGARAARLAFAAAMGADVAVGGAQAQLPSGQTLLLVSASETDLLPEGPFAVSFLGWGLGDESSKDQDARKKWRAEATVTIHHEDSY